MPAAFAGLNGTGVIDGTNSVLTFNTTRDVFAGERVMVVTGNNGGSQTTSTITVGSLSLARDKNGPFSNNHHELWSALAGSTVASGSTVTVTLPASVTSCIHGICFGFTGLFASGYLDVSATATTLSNATQVSGLTAATARGFGVAVASLRVSANRIITATAGYTTTGGEIQDGTALQSMAVAYKILTAGSAGEQETWTLDTSASADGLIQVYRADVTIPFVPHRMPLGV